MSSFTVSHIGLCVCDLQRSLRFYCDGLGFAKSEAHVIDNTYADALEVARDVDLDSQFIAHEGLSIELLYYRSPEAVGRPSTSRGMVGLTHLSFIVEDVDAAVVQLAAAGGTLLPGTRTRVPGVDLVFVTDPDGTRVELMALGGNT
jgi:catechol 2,3-dioxygenase-like lactoylglutathione lyase family enzyme